ncbi:MAG: rhodanese-like domain-containing protein [Chitinophagaceae bacterium]|nr:rhodanese-like domain-containing protein [Chitinophagaceae bacterium]
MELITVEDLKSRIENGEKLHLIDVREPNENAEYNIGGILLPLGQIRDKLIDEIKDLKNEEVILYCRSGNRSGQACGFLETLGFTNTRNLEGGMLKWQEKFH